MDYTAENIYRSSADLIIKTNEQYWGVDQEDSSKNEWIYVLHDVHTRFSLCVLENIVAKGLQEKERLPLAAIISGRADYLMKLVDKIDGSFGIQQRFHPSYHDYNSKEIEDIAKRMAAETYGDKEKLIDLTYRNVRFGDSIYDDILRGGDVRNRGKVFNCFDISQEQYYCYIRNALAIIDQAFEIFSVMPPRFLITTQYFYTKGLYAHVAKAMGATILITSIDCPSIIVQVKPDNRALSEIKIADIFRAKMGTCLAEYQTAGTVPENLFVIDMAHTKNGGQISGLQNRKNVFILPHAFADAPRAASKLNFYHDYQEWFIDTMRIIKNIPNVNWIIKDHPWTAYYKQEDYVRSIFEEYKTDQIFLFDSTYSGMNIKNFADCVITATGDAGIEYWAYGIPTITIGEAYYCNWGISHQMKTLTEYENALRSINDISKPSKESMELARKYLTIRKNWGKRCDAYSGLLWKLGQEEEATFGAGGAAHGMKEAVDQQLAMATRSFSEDYTALLKESDLRSSAIYRLENLCEI